MSYRKSVKRKHKRYMVDSIQGNILYPSHLKVLDISIDGAAIETTKRLDINKEYTLKIKYKDSMLNLRGRVVWSLLTYGEKRGSQEIIPVYRAGMKFTDTLSEKTNILLNFIEDNKISTIENRLGGVRFKINQNKNIKLEYPHKYKVKKISLSGMLVETEYPLGLNTQHTMELSLNANMLSILGRVAYCEKIVPGNITKYDIGIEFIKISDYDNVLLKDFLNSIGDKSI